MWLDVACTKFHDRESRLDEEVSRQREIFSGASQSFIWLSRTETQSLNTIWKELLEISNSFWGDKEALRAADDIAEILIARALPTMKRLLEDPWFTSLWTLQEAIANPDAILLSANGIPSVLQNHASIAFEDSSQAEIWYQDSTSSVRILPIRELKFGPRTEIQDYPITYVTLRHLVHISKTILDVAIACAQPSNGVEDLKNLIEQSGLSSFASFNVMRLWKVAQDRHEQNHGDQIEYIHKHILGFPSGLGTPFSEHPKSASRIEEYFSIQLMCHFPVLSQLFVRTRICEEPGSWIFSKDCTLPDVDLIFTCFEKYIPLLEVSIFTTQTTVDGLEFTGYSVNFSSAMESLSQSSGTSRLLGISFDAVTDCPSMTAFPTRQPLRLPNKEIWHVSTERKSQIIRLFDLHVHGSDVRLLLLARAGGLQVSSPALGMGLIIRQKTEGAWQRLGWCYWTFESDSTGNNDDAQEGLVANSIGLGKLRVVQLHGISE